MEIARACREAELGGGHARMLLEYFREMALVEEAGPETYRRQRSICVGDFSGCALDSEVANVGSDRPVIVLSECSREMRRMDADSLGDR